MRWTLSDAHDQAVIDASAARHRAAVVARQPDRQQSRRRASSKARSTFTEPPLVENPIAMSPASRVGDELAGEHQVEADVVGERGEDRPVVDERQRGQAAALRRVRNSSAVASASVALPPLPNVNSRPPCRKRWAIASPACAARSPHCVRASPSRSVLALGHLAPRRRGEIGEQRRRVALVGIDERVQEAGRLGRHVRRFLGSTVSATPACTSTRSPG